MKDRYGTYSPKGTRWTFSKVPTIRPSGAQTTISLRNVVADAGSVTPAARVVCSRRAIWAIWRLWLDPRSGPASAMTSSGHSTSVGGGVAVPRTPVAATCAAKTAAG